MNLQAFLSTLPYMAKGMLGIFAVTAILIVSILILNKSTSGVNKSENNTDSSENKN